MSISTEGRNRRKLSIGIRLCPPASSLPSPLAAASAAVAACTLSTDRYSKAGGFMSAPPEIRLPLLGECLASFSIVIAIGGTIDHRLREETSVRQRRVIKNVFGTGD